MWMWIIWITKWTQWQQTSNERKRNEKTSHQTKKIARLSKAKQNQAKMKEEEHWKKIDGLVHIVHSTVSNVYTIYVWKKKNHRFGSVALAYSCDSNELITSVPNHIIHIIVCRIFSSFFSLFYKYNITQIESTLYTMISIAFSFVHFAQTQIQAYKHTCTLHTLNFCAKC